MNDIEKSAAKSAASFISGLLQGWGVPAAWAKAITGAIVGAAIGILIATGLLASCTHVSKQTAADGTTTERAFSLNPDFARRALELWGVPHVPVINTAK